MAKPKNLEPVSYTHLDVYKRQVHERDRKGSIQTTQEVEIYFNFVGRFVPPAFGEVELTPCLLYTSSHRTCDFHRIRRSIDCLHETFNQSPNLSFILLLTGSPALADY